MVADLGERKQRTEQEEAHREMMKIALGLLYFGLCLGMIFLLDDDFLMISDVAIMMMIMMMLYNIYSSQALRIYIILNLIDDLKSQLKCFLRTYL